MDGYQRIITRQEVIARVADLMAQDLGERALEVAVYRARGFLDRHDPETCRDWMDVVALLVLRGGGFAGQPKPRLHDRPRGAVTRQFAAPDQFEQLDVETLLVDASRERLHV